MANVSKRKIIRPLQRLEVTEVDPVTRELLEAKLLADYRKRHELVEADPSVTVPSVAMPNSRWLLALCSIAAVTSTITMVIFVLQWLLQG